MSNTPHFNIIQNTKSEALRSYISAFFDPKNLKLMQHLIVLILKYKNQLTVEENEILNSKEFNEVMFGVEDFSTLLQPKQENIPKLGSGLKQKIIDLRSNEEQNVPKLGSGLKQKIIGLSSNEEQNIPKLGSGLKQKIIDLRLNE
uniref:Uncharacterized protein n=1 Tax=viral metagenome TaxID=1070528 RepID=A0A6C0BEM1_9ZZZZ